MSVVLVPMKTFGAAKTRLRAQLESAAREAFARASFEAVLAAATSCELITRVYVLTNGDDVAAVATSAGAEVLRDPLPLSGSLGPLLDWGLDTLAARGATRALILMADLPQLTGADVHALALALQTHDCVAAPDRHGHSTNALGLRVLPPAATAFGHPESYAQHLALARARGWSTHEFRGLRVAHDVDTPEDLRLFAAAASEGR